MIDAQGVGSSALAQICRGGGNPHPESWFSILTRQHVGRGSYDSVGELIAAIERFVASWNDRACPFVWPKTADEVLAKAVKQQATSETEH